MSRHLYPENFKFISDSRKFTQKYPGLDRDNYNRSGFVIDVQGD